MEFKVFKEIRELGAESDFTRELEGKLEQWGSLTEKQVLALERVRDQAMETKAVMTKLKGTDDFTKSLKEFYKKRGFLTKKQLASAKKTVEKMDYIDANINEWKKKKDPFHKNCVQFYEKTGFLTPRQLEALKQKK
jgi:hypothetical protein